MALQAAEQEALAEQAALALALQAAEQAALVVAQAAEQEGLAGVLSEF